MLDKKALPSLSAYIFLAQWRLHAKLEHDLKCD